MSVYGLCKKKRERDSECVRACVRACVHYVRGIETITECVCGCADCERKRESSDSVRVWVCM